MAPQYGQELKAHRHRYRRSCAHRSTWISCAPGSPKGPSIHAVFNRCSSNRTCGFLPHPIADLTSRHTCNLGGSRRTVARNQRLAAELPRKPPGTFARCQLIESPIPSIRFESVARSQDVLPPPALPGLDQVVRPCRLPGPPCSPGVGGARLRPERASRDGAMGYATNVAGNTTVDLGTGCLCR